MTIVRTKRGDYVARYGSHQACGYSMVEAIINLLTLIMDIK